MNEAATLNGAANFTCRNISRVSAGGTAVRITLSNRFVPTGTTFGSVTVGKRTSGGSIAPGTLHSVTFGGATTVTVPAGAEVTSDAVPLDVAAGDDLAVSTYLPGAVLSFDNHTYASATHYCTAMDGSAGDRSMDLSDALYPNVSTNVAWVSGVDVTGGTSTGAVITLGDSITAGARSTNDAFRAWPDFLARRLVAAGSPLSVVNEGISGDTLLAGGSWGPTGLNRFASDVLAKSNAKTVIVALGSNDIAYGSTSSNGSVGAQEVINGLSTVVNSARRAGLRVVGATILARHDGWGGSDDAKDATRDAVNTWIRTSGRFDAVLDFDAATLNPAPGARNYLRPEFDSGDHIHPNDAGYDAMANSIDLSVLSGPASPAPVGATWLVGAEANRCLDVNGQNTANGGVIDIWDCVGQDNEKWALNADGSVVGQQSHRCLDVNGEATADGSTIDIWDCVGQANEKWTLNADGSIVGQQSGKCLAVYGGSTANGSSVRLSTCNGQANQKWTQM